MKMTIDESIKYLIALKRCETCEAGDIDRCKSCSCYRIGSSAKCYDAIDVAIENMRKYQKIKEQVDIAIDKENFAISDARMIQIREIINGDDD